MMGYVSYSEDILERHQSDVHELMRKLEAGQLPEQQQYGAIPEFRNLVQKLSELLTDPSQPIAMRLMNVSSRVTNLEFDLKILNEKNAKLAESNASLNQRNQLLENEIDRCRAESKALRSKLSRSSTQIAVRDQKASKIDAELADAKQAIRKLEEMLLAAQVDVRF
ncbi:hypothetical protein LY632_11525 [Erythrobacter sp. SDW2]|uniref:hypothetical protein n=1 Tax=Erythrobacter sp. SDW2 TaxID=2907154 RepID=UPI001F2FBD8C|nr:hypothetical protein [Erythrobacter sp. SDW2]UIP06314.1 hypothetical protein LY632_11525 [Erythrobacter sp. SDW2]